MQRIISLILSLLLYTPAAFADNYILFKFPATASQKIPVRYARLKVVDARNNKQELGYILTGQFDKHCRILPEYELGAMLSDHYSKILEQADVNGNELLLILHSIGIVEGKSRTNNRFSNNNIPFGMLHFSGDFFIGNNNSYHFVGSVDSAWRINKIKTQLLGDISNSILTTTTSKITNLLLQYGNSTYTVSDNVYTIASASTKRANEKRNFPIYTTTSFKKGIYYTADQFIQHSPADTIFERSYSAAKIPGQPPHTYGFQYPDGKKVTDYFAIYDGTQWYLKHDKIMLCEQREFYAETLLHGWYNNTEAISPIGFEPDTDKIHGGKKVRLFSISYPTQFDPVKKHFTP